MPLDVFSQDAFATITLTTAINQQDFQPGQVGQLGIFQLEPVSDRRVMVEEQAGALALVATTEYGAPAVQNQRDKRKARTLTASHLAIEDTLLAAEVQGIRAFGTEDERQSIEIVRDRLLARMAAKLDVTIEHLRMGAVKGIVLDADGSTVIHNLFSEFGITQPSEVNFELTTDATKVLDKISGVIVTIEDALGGAPWQPPQGHPGVHCFCSQEFWDALITHPDVQKAYERWQDGAFLRQLGFKGAAGGVFDFGGARFERYRGKVGNRRFIDADKAHFFPVGVPELFVNYFAPADFNETVNTPGLPRYAKAAEDQEFQRYIKLHAQSNPLPICTRPGVLVQAKKA